jgi:hypothetical protein
MSAPVTAGTQWQWPADVLEFAAKENVQDCLDPLLEATRHLFPTARRIRVILEDDPEIRDDWHIVFEVQVPASDVPNFVEAVHRWNRALYRVCPYALVCIFRLDLERVSP